MILDCWKTKVSMILRKFSFTNRIVNIRNSLPNALVDDNSVDAFKSRLDNFWKFQDVKINNLHCRPYRYRRSIWDWYINY